MAYCPKRLFWLLVNQRPVGFSPGSFTGPFLSFLAYAQFLLPLAVLELYFYAKERATLIGQWSTAVIMLVLTVATGVGIAGAGMGMWLPRL